MPKPFLALCAWKAKALCLSLFLALWPGLSLAQEVVHLAVGEWYPFFSERMDGGGLLAHAVTEAFALEGIETRYEFLPWERALVYVKEGLADGSPGWIKNPEREALCLYSEPIFHSRTVLWHLKSFPFDWLSFEDLKGIPMGGTIGYNYGEGLQRAEKSGLISMERTATDIENYKKLLAGCIKLFPQLLVVGHRQLLQHFSPEEFQRVTYHPRPVYVADYYLLLSKKNPQCVRLMDAFNRGLRRMQESGRVDELLAAPDTKASGS